MDNITKVERSLIMSKVKNKDTKLETSFRKLLWKEGIRYLKNNNKLFGRPDMVIKKKKVVIFIDSCFWHGCDKHLRMPKSNKKYWFKKIKRNKKRDNEVNIYYPQIGWRILRIWEHDLDRDIKDVINKTIKFINF